MAKPKKSAYAILTVHVPVVLNKTVRHLAVENRRTLSAQVAMLLEEALATREAQPPVLRKVAG